MNQIKGVLRNHLFERPFDFYVAFLIFLAGIYSFISDSWPEKADTHMAETFIVTISLYLIISSAIVMASLVLRRRKWPVFSLMGEMYGWLFISAASIATVLMYVGVAISYTPNKWSMWIVMVVIWFGLFIASGVRFLDLFRVYRSVKK